jgi:asparagine synthase (glutamine-hydrolysing)
VIFLCGIAGFNFADRALAKAMCSAMKHRGPDDSGQYADSLITLCHLRLSIIDLSKKGHQPMCNEDKSVWVTYNGEIYNYPQIRERLEEKGHRFSSHSDTEAIIHAYEEYGFECLTHFRGMFAFAIWDSKKKILFIARDRLGIKPVYYYRNEKENKFCFASEIKAILQDPDIKREMSKQDLHDYLTFRYVPLENTMFSGIKKLLPAHYMVMRLGKNRISDFKTVKYWEPSWDLKKTQEESAASEYRRLLSHSVISRLRSDVPLGVFLSGGIDSSTILSIMSENVEKQIKTFTVGYGLPNFTDETGVAAKVARHYNTDHHEFIVPENPVNTLPEIVWHMDEPLADPTALPIFHLSRLSKKYVTVVLLGEGADETLAGYEHYKIMSIQKKLNRFVPKPVRTTLIPAAFNITPDRVKDRFFKYSTSLGEEGKRRFFKFLGHSKAEDSYVTINSIFNEDEKKMLYGKSMAGDYSGPERIIRHALQQMPQNNGGAGFLNSLLSVDKDTFLQHLLIKTDKMSMASSIETRVPFLETDVVEFLSTVPEKYKLHGMKEKYLLRRAFTKRLPDFITQKKKQRFFVPIHEWIAQNQDIERVLLSSSLEKGGYIRSGYIKSVFDKYDKSKLYYGRQMWTLLNLELWHRTFIDGDMKKPVLRMDRI